MNEESHVILGVHLTDRVHEAVKVQSVFTEYGCNIKTRIGLHHVDDRMCSPRGLILLEIYGGEPVAVEMTGKLTAIPGVEVQKMIFAHD